MHIDPESPYYNDFRQFQKELQGQLRKIRNDHGHTQQDMANTGMSQRHYERMEQDETAIISLWQIYRLAKFYGVSAAELIDVE